MVLILLLTGVIGGKGSKDQAEPTAKPKQTAEAKKEKTKEKKKDKDKDLPRYDPDEYDMDEDELEQQMTEDQQKTIAKTWLGNYTNNSDNKTFNIYAAGNDSFSFSCDGDDQEFVAYMEGDTTTFYCDELEWFFEKTENGFDLYSREGEANFYIDSFFVY